MANGIDISGWQKGINLSLVPADFVVVKATQGTDYVSSDFIRQADQTLATGKMLGLYHFANGWDATAEADHFVSHVRPYLGRAVLVLDFEADALVKGGAWAKSFMDRVFATTGIKPMIYTSGSVAAKEDMRQVAAGDYGLWVASWGSNTSGGYHEPSPASPGVWPFYAIHQYSSHGRLPNYGGDLDLNYTSLTAETWAKYASPAVSVPPVVSVPKPAPAPAPSPVKGVNYTVQKGDTLSSIGEKFHLPWQTIYKANAGTIGSNPNVIHAGQVLHITTATSVPAPEPTRKRTYTVKRGDSLSSIAAQLRVSGGWQTLYALNRKVVGSDPNVIHVGAVLAIP